MELTQTRLTKSEWDSIEKPVCAQEQSIIALIIDRYSKVELRTNQTITLYSYLKISPSKQMDEYLYSKYLAPIISRIAIKYEIPQLNINVSSTIKIKSGDKIRLDKINTEGSVMTGVFEFVLADFVSKCVILKHNRDIKWQFYYYTLYKLIRYTIPSINSFMKTTVNILLDKYEPEFNISHIIYNSADYIERNSNLLKYADTELYSHQKELFSLFRRSRDPKLVLYIAPTGTGKTLSPLGLSESYKIIYVCAARHVGLALARSAIAVEKKIAFAFGCSCASDIRLHYFSAKEYTKNWKSGGIYKVDNSVGDNVEIVICDIRSYLHAMHYMLAFNSADNIITYLDEPTISLDYPDHPLHEIIKRNWIENVIPKMVLCSATLPKIHELTETVADFRSKFLGSEVFSVIGNDCKKTIPLINNNGYVVMPHTLAKTYPDLLTIVERCEESSALLRHLDLAELSDFIQYAEKNNIIKPFAAIGRHFRSLEDIDMKTVKLHYLTVLKNIIPEKWPEVYEYVHTHREPRIKENTHSSKLSIVKSNSIDITTEKAAGSAAVAATVATVFSNKIVGGDPLRRTSSEQVISKSGLPGPTKRKGSSGVYVTTSDAHTLTDGPTIFLATDVCKVANFCIQRANIPESVMSGITNKITYNDAINERIRILEKEIEDEHEKNLNKCSNAADASKMSDGKMARMKNGKIVKLQDNIDVLKNSIKITSLNSALVPNKPEHIEYWTGCDASDHSHSSAFSGTIDDETIAEIMLLEEVENSWKILLLLGIGVFSDYRNIRYTEIMKKLADKQHLYMIIAGSDYIYGTNYQLCHGYLSKDLALTQDKIEQAIGRIGRGNIQQEYSVRFRDDAQINKLFELIPAEQKMEIMNMNRLFNK